jgi:hypothetical protein
MSIREGLQKRPKTTVAIVLIVIAAAVGSTIYQGGTGQGRASLSTAYFTADDGASLVSGDGRNVREMEGRTPPMYQAAVYQERSGGAKFVAYITRLPPASLADYTQALAEINRQRATLSAADPALDKAYDAYNAKLKAIDATTEVKRPGAANKWVPLNSPEGQEIVSNLKSPTGSADVKVIYPS